MRIRVLGSAAGGGVPQWNCGCDNCRAARTGEGRVVPRTQESVALSADGQSWFLLNVSPEIRAQIESFEGLWPREPRHSPVAGLFLTNGDLDHCLGLLSLRESHPLTVYATGAVRAGFTEDNVLYRTLERFAGQLTWRPLPLGEALPLATSSSSASASGGELSVTAVSAAGKLPLHLEGRRSPSPEDNVGLVFRAGPGGTKIAYFSGVAGPSPELDEAVRDASLLFFDGTFWSSDELIAAGLGTRRAEDMAHWPVGGANGSLRYLAERVRGRLVYVHINNTNPMLREDGPERREVLAAGAEIASDGWEIAL